MNQLTFQTGSFAGETIRTTSDGYASIYDVMKVAGVGRDAPTAWSELQSRLPQIGVTSDTSESRPLVKTFKFPGRGQRDTPVVSGQGLVRLLFLLPGKRARQFVAESAEVLVRHIGGDESLVEEIRRNREIGQTNPQSAQAFMAVNIPNEHSVALIDRELDLEERRARLDRLKEENKAYKLDVLDKYKVYANENINDPRIKEQINNEITNQILLAVQLPKLIESGAPVQPFQSAEVSIDQIATEMGKRLTTTQKSSIGRDVAKKYRQENPSTDINTIEKYVNGEMRFVKIYPRSFVNTIQACINEITN